MKLLLLLLVTCAIDSAVSQCENVEVKFVVIRGRNSSNLEPLSVPWFAIRGLLYSHFFDNNKKTVVFSYGFSDTFQSPSTQLMINAYMTRRNEFNILIIDWGKYSGGNYFLQAVPNALKVGEFIGHKMSDMANRGFNLQNFHLIGHSLGAHLVGQIGRTLKAKSIELPRITGLDPAGPGFFPLNPFLIALNSSVAKFVDIIHTDSQFFGANYATGHVDIWPNGGSNQPGCPPIDYANELGVQNFCSHGRSLQYYAESVLRNESSPGFATVQCDSWATFTQNKCPSQTTAGANFSMGIYSSPLMSGNFYLQTNPQFPFSRDIEGTKYVTP